MAKALLLVDPQNDFITGTLPVPGAAAAMDALASGLRDRDGQYALKIVTLDTHPWNHCSFTEHGGPWPRHCVANSIGAAIYTPLLAPLHETYGPIKTIGKGRQTTREEYSAFQAYKNEILALITEYDVNVVDICGIAGDVCVLQTLRDGLVAMPDIVWNVLEDFAPSLDGGKALAQFCEDTSCARS